MQIRAAATLAILAATAITLGVYFRPRVADPSGDAPIPPRQALEDEASSKARPAIGSGASAELSVADLEALTIQSLSSPDESTRALGVSEQLSELARRDPLAAVRVADLFADSSARPQILSAVARGWVAHNHRYALAWAQGLSDENEREAVLVEIFTRIAEDSPADAVRLRQEFEGGQNRDAELANLTQRWAERDLSAVLGWTDSLPPGEQREQMHARVAFIQSQSNPAEAAQLVLDRIPPGSAQAEALISVVHQWARRDLDAASAWIARIPDPALRERANQEFAAVMLQLASGN